MTTREIRERTISLLQACPSGLRYLDLVRTISAESPETPYGTIYAQVAEVPNRHPEIVFRPERGLFKLCAGNGAIHERFAVSTPLRRDKNTLESLGFVEVGEWSIDGIRLRCDLPHCGDRAPVLYAFIVSGEVRYVGKSAMPLGKRMYQYGQPGPSQYTNLRINARIRNVLEQGSRVEIWALSGWEPIDYRGIPVNLAAGIEDAVIERMRPSWNGGRRTATV